jgi:DNA-3-methyladenine glycosylase I
VGEYSVLYESTASFASRTESWHSGLARTIRFVRSLGVARSSRIVRCAWVGADALAIRYHDEEWGVPVWDDRRLFEFLVLEGAQAGLSWMTILRKRDNYRAAFAGFDPQRVARYSRVRIEALLRDPGIVRNRLKVEAAVANARAFLEVQEEFGRFADYQWRFVDGRPVQNRWRRIQDVPPRSSASDAFSKDLRARGFRFVGSTIMYAHMQAVGMVNDHVVSCFRHEAVRPTRLRSRRPPSSPSEAHAFVDSSQFRGKRRRPP